MDIAISDYVSGEVNLYTIPDVDDVNDFMNSYCGMSFIDSGLELTDENSYLVGLLVNKLLGGSF